MAVTDPLAVYQTLTYTGGTVTAPKGVLQAIFPSRIPSWLPNGQSGTGRRPFGSRQRNNRRAGEDLSIRFNDGTVFVVRVCGSHTKFLQNFLAQGNSDTVMQIWSERGTVYGPQYAALAP